MVIFDVKTRGHNMFCENREEFDYFVMNLPDGELKWSYSAKKLQEELSEVLEGQILQGVFVELFSYLESKQLSFSRTNLINLTYMGGRTLLVFDHTVLELEIHVQGMIEYRMFSRCDLQMEKVYDCPPDDMYNQRKYYLDINNHDITHEFANHRVEIVCVIGTETWATSFPDFDEALGEEAADENDLATEIALLLDNNTGIAIVGDVIEYFYIEIANVGENGHDS